MSTCVTIDDLTGLGTTPESNDYLLIKDTSTGTTKKVTVSDLMNYEAADRLAEDLITRASVGLTAAGALTIDESIAAINSAALSSFGYSATLYNMLKALSRRYLAFEGLNNTAYQLKPVLAVVDANTAPPTLVSGDAYIIQQDAELNINNINWQSGNTVRYTFSGSPDLSGYAASSYLEARNCTNAENDGIFVISAVNDAADWIEVTNLAVSSNAYDEAGSPGDAGVTLQNWGSNGHNYHVIYDGSLWNGTAPIEGMKVWDKSRYYDMAYTYDFDDEIITWCPILAEYKVTLTLDQSTILALNSAPQIIIPAPGAGYMIIPKVVIFTLVYDTAVFATNTTIQIYHDTANRNIITDNVILTAAQTTTGYSTTILSSGGGANVQLIENKDLKIDVASGDPTGGGATSQLIINMSYTIIKV